MKESALFQLPTKTATRVAARSLARELKGSDLIILDGPLGAGKTFFARALCAHLRVSEGEELRVTSPTYTLVHEYETRPPVCHADLYRLESERDVFELGLQARRDQGAVLLVEWGKPYAEVLGGDGLTVRMGFEPRTLQLAAEGPRSESLLGLLEAVLTRELGVA